MVQLSRTMEKKVVPMKASLTERIAILGFGEAGGVFGHDLVAAGKQVIVYDSLLKNDSQRKPMLEKAEAAKVQVAESLEQAIGEADLVLATVTASSAIPLARQAAASLHQNQIYLDMNSVSPDTKKDIGAEIEKSGANFVEAAVMAAVRPARLKVEILLGGIRSAELAEQLRAIGMNTTAVSEKLGVASAIKMCRSIVIKGLAALAIESLFAARRYGAEDAVIASFEGSYPGMGWANSLPDSLARRASEHSRRRASEMREVVETLKAVGMNSGMASATADLQDWLTKEMEVRSIVYNKDQPLTWRELADGIARPVAASQLTERE
jgi:3-hydroxyisobutyrate dehydrogenase-like beta-hydroxyacid dehydrogenase